MTGPTREEVEEWKREAGAWAKTDHACAEYSRWIDAYVAKITELAFAAGSRSSSAAGAELVREIEEAARVAMDAPEIMDATLLQRDCYWLLENDDLWPRLRTALLSGARSGEDARDAARYRRFRSATMDERRRFEHYSDTALDVVLDAAMGGK